MTAAAPRGRYAYGPTGRLRTLCLVASWGLVVLALAYDAVLTLRGLPAPGSDPADTRMQDFRDALYYPVREFLDGGVPYDPARMFAHWPVLQEFDLYLPAHLWLFAPLALVPFATGAVLMLLLDGAAVVAIAGWGMRRATGRPHPLGWPLLAAFLLMSQVGKAQLYLGQINPVVALGVTGAVLHRDRRWAGALALAVAWLKPQYGLPLCLLLLARGAGGTVLRGTALAAVASLPVVGVLVARSGGIGGFLQVVSDNLAYATGTGYGAVDSPTGTRTDVVAVLARLLDATPPAGSEAVAAVLVLGTSAALLRAARHAEPRSPAADLADLLTVLAVLTALVHQPGDSLATAAVATVAGVTLLRRSRPHPFRRAGGLFDPAGGLLHPAHGLRGVLALVMLTIPFLHLDVVDRAVRATLGERTALTVDGVALTLAWALAALAVARADRRAARTGPRATAGPVTGRPDGTDPATGTPDGEDPAP